MLDTELAASRDEPCLHGGDDIFDCFASPDDRLEVASRAAAEAPWRFGSAHPD